MYDTYEQTIEDAVLSRSCEDEEEDFVLSLDDLYGMEVYAED